LRYELRTMNRVPFLTAEWRYLVMLNYQIDPAALRPLVPPGTELDFFEGTTFVSVVGFRFLNTKVRGWTVPFHRDFEEVNLRFYVRRRVAGEWRRGVVFIRELVPRWAIAWVARTCYGEPYRSLPMRHEIGVSGGEVNVEYGWCRRGTWESVRAAGVGSAQPIANGSLEEFITEHYWGYTARRHTCTEYQVEHPHWRVWQATEATLCANVTELYGHQFADSLAVPPASAFIADGSPVNVWHKSTVSDILSQ
jgi:uncharacterized protein